MKPCAGIRAIRLSQMRWPSRFCCQSPFQSPAPVQVITKLIVVLLSVERTLLGRPEFRSKTMTMKTGPTMKTGRAGTLAKRGRRRAQGCVAEAQTAIKRSATHPHRRSRIQQRAPKYHFKEHIPGSSFDFLLRVLYLRVDVCQPSPHWLFFCIPISVVY